MGYDCSFDDDEGTGGTRRWREIRDVNKTYQSFGCPERCSYPVVVKGCDTATERLSLPHRPACQGLPLMNDVNPGSILLAFFLISA